MKQYSRDEAAYGKDLAKKQDVDGQLKAIVEFVSC